jgi:hypothetical protein
MTYRGLSTLLVIHGFVMLIAGIVLAVAPSLIPSVVGIDLEPNAYLVAYLLAGAEIGFAVLSFGGSRITDRRSLKLIAWSCVAFHGVSAVLEAYVAYHRVSRVLIGNIVARFVIIGLFAYFSRGLK